MTRHLLHQSPIFQSPFILACVGFIYFLSGYLGLALAIPGTNVTPVWPPSGIALAATLLLGYRSLIPIFFASAILNFVVLKNLSPPNVAANLIACCGIGAGATLQAYVGAYFIHYFIVGKNYFNSMPSVLTFLAISTLSSLVNSTIGTFFISITGFIPWETFHIAWWTWWVGDTGGIFMFTPFILAWVKFYPDKWPFNKTLELLSIILAIGVTSWLSNLGYRPLTFLFTAWLVWAAIRFHMLGATLALFVTVVLIVFETVNGYGPFVSDSLNKSLLQLQLFILVVTTMILALAAELSGPKTKTNF